MATPPLDYRHDLGPLGDLLPARLSAAPQLVPVPASSVESWETPHPVVIGVQTPVGGWAWRYDCWALTQPEVSPAGRVEIAVSVEPELALGSPDLAYHRPGRHWWIPIEQAWFEQPSDADPTPRREVPHGRPSAPPTRSLTRAPDADRVIGRQGWLAHPTGWHLVVAVTDLYEDEVDDQVKKATGRRPEDSLRDVFVHVVRRRSWWRWGVAGDLPAAAVFRVEADGLWLE